MAAGHEGPAAHHRDLRVQLPGDPRTVRLPSDMLQFGVCVSDRVVTFLKSGLNMNVCFTQCSDHPCAARVPHHVDARLAAHRRDLEVEVPLLRWERLPGSSSK